MVNPQAMHNGTQARKPANEVAWTTDRSSLKSRRNKTFEGVWYPFVRAILVRGRGQSSPFPVFLLLKYSDNEMRRPGEQEI